MKKTQTFCSLAAVIINLWVVVLCIGCSSPPLIQPEVKDISPNGQTDPISTKVKHVPHQASETTVPGKVIYSAEKIGLDLFSLNVDLSASGVSMQDTEPLQFSFGGWSNNGQQFAFAIPNPEFKIDPDAPTENNIYTTAELWIVNLDGTTLQKITDQVGSLVLWSLDDSQIAYYKHIGVSKEELWIIDLATNTHTKLGEPTGVNINDTDIYGDIHWLDNRHLLYRTIPKEVTGKKQLWIHNVQTGYINDVLIDEILGETWRNLKLAPNKKSIVGRIEDTLWLGELVKQNDQWRLDYIKTIIDGDVVIPYWSPDSSWLAIESLERSERLLQIINVTTHEIISIPFSNTVINTEWSPDSQVLMVSNWIGGTNNQRPIYVVNKDGSGLRKIGGFFFSGTKWSPNGQYLGLSVASDPNIGNPFGIVKVDITP